MGNEKKSMVTMLVLTIVAVAVCAGAIVFLKGNRDEEKVVLEEKKIEEPKVVKKKEIVQVTKVVAPTPVAELTEEEKQSKQREDWKQASKEMMDMFQGSKMQELIHKRMSSRNKEYLSELFEKHGIDAEAQDLIASTITKSQSEFMQTMMQNGFRGGEQTEEQRAEMAEKLTAINQAAEENIKNLSSDAFLADSKDKRNTEVRDHYIRRVDWGMKKDNKMDDKQKSSMNALYADNQVSEVEMLTLPKEDIAKRQENINNGARDILNEEQYKDFEKNETNAFSARGLMRGGGMGGRRGRRR